MAGGYFGVYKGTVVNNADPEKAGRLLLQVPSVTGLRQTAWATPSHPSGLPVLVPKAGDPVWVMFEAGDTIRPLWVGIPGSSAFNGGSVGGTGVAFDALTVGDLTVNSTITVPDASIPVSKISGLTTALADYVTLDTTQTITGAKTFSTGLSVASGQSIILRDSYHYLRYNATPDGPELSGYGGGILGDSTGTRLAWSSTGVAVTGGLSFTGTLTAGTVPWARLSGVPTYATRWPTWDEVTSKPTDLATTDTAQSITAVKSFTVSPTVPDSSWSIASTTGLQAALDSKYSPTNPQPVTPPSITGAMLLMGA